ncbi:MAG: cupin domain-containing protein [Bacteroidota bacterium]
MLDSQQLDRMHPEARLVYQHFDFEVLPVEGTFFRQTYRSEEEWAPGWAVGTAMIGMYCHEPQSLSCFHRLAQDEIWHFYQGDPLHLYLLYEDGRSEEVVLGTDFRAGHHIQYKVPAGVWQGGCLSEGGRYALFGCTLAPGFHPSAFEAGLAADLMAKYPDRKDIIAKLSVNEDVTQLPDDFPS